MRSEAEDEVRGAFLIEAIAEREGITSTDADLQKRIAELAAARNENAKRLHAELEKDQAHLTSSRPRFANRRPLTCSSRRQRSPRAKQSLR